MKHKSLICVLLSIILVIHLASCSIAPMKQKKNIAVIVKSEHSSFWQMVEKGVNAAATEYNVNFSFEGPLNEEDFEKQNQMIMNAVDRSVDAIVLSAIDYEKCAKAVTIATQKGIKIVAIDSMVHSSAVPIFIGTDNFGAGKKSANASKDIFQKDEKIYIGVISCSSDTDNIKQREKGFREQVSQMENAEIVTVLNVDSNKESAENGVWKLLTNYPKINLIVGFNEFITLGIGEAISKMGNKETVHTIGFDANPESVNKLESGDIDTLIVQNPFSIGYLGIKNAVDLIEGNVTESVIYTQVSVITKENMFYPENQKLLFDFK